jgi:hypothetical protein
MKRNNEDIAAEPTLRKRVENGEAHIINCKLCKTRKNMEGIRFYQDDVGPVDNPVSYCEYTLFKEMMCDTYGCEQCMIHEDRVQHVIVIIQAINIQIKIPTHHSYFDANWFEYYLSCLGFEKCRILDRYFRDIETHNRCNFIDLSNMPFRITNEYGGVLQVNWNKLMHALNGNTTQIPNYLDRCAELELKTGLKIINKEKNRIMNRLEFKMNNKPHPKDKLEKIYKEIMDEFAEFIQEERQHKFAEDQKKFEKHSNEVRKLTFKYAGDVSRIGLYTELSDQDKRAIKTIVADDQFRNQILKMHGHTIAQVTKKNDCQDIAEIELLLTTGLTLQQAFDKYKMPKRLQKQMIKERGPKVEKKDKKEKIEKGKKDKNVEIKKNIEGKTVEQALQTITQAPKTETVIKKVVMEDEQTGLNIEDDAPKNNFDDLPLFEQDFYDDGFGEVIERNPNSKKEEEVKKDDDVEIPEKEKEKEKKPFGFLKILQHLKDTWSYHYRFATPGFVSSFMPFAIKLASWMPTIINLVPWVMRMCMCYYEGKNMLEVCKDDFRRPGWFRFLYLYAAAQYFVQRILSHILITPVIDHKIVVTDIEQVPQRDEDEKREYDTHFETTKLETKIHFEEQVTAGLLVHSPHMNFIVPYHQEVSEHTASGELVANIIGPTSINSTISNVSLMERVAKSTNIGSFIDYDRVDSFFEDTVAGSERLALGVVFEQRCKSMLTSPYQQVFPNSGDMYLLPVKDVRKPICRHSIWKPKPNRSIMGIFSTVIGQMKSNLRNFQFPTTLPMLLQRICSFMTQSFAHLWRLVKLMLTFLLYYLDQTLLILILLSMVSRSGWRTILRVMINC